MYFVFIFICFRRDITNSVCLCVHAGELDVTYLYTKDEPLKWNYQTFSYYFGFKYALGSVTLILVTPILKYFAISDHVICLVGIVSKAAGCVLLSLSTTDTLIFIGKWTCYGNRFPSVHILFCASEPEQTAGFIGGSCISEVYRIVIMIIRLDCAEHQNVVQNFMLGVKTERKHIYLTFSVTVTLKILIFSSSGLYVQFLLYTCSSFTAV